MAVKRTKRAGGRLQKVFTVDGKKYYVYGRSAVEVFEKEKAKREETGMIHIERTITRTETGSYVIGDDAKTAAGRRTIPMNEQIKDIIASQKEINAMLDGKIVSMSDLIFRVPERGLLMATPMDREIKRICKVAGLKPL